MRTKSDGSSLTLDSNSKLHLDHGLVLQAAGVSQYSRHFHA
jgi:hypothetical protein